MQTMKDSETNTIERKNFINRNICTSENVLHFRLETSLCFNPTLGRLTLAIFQVLLPFSMHFCHFLSHFPGIFATFRYLCHFPGTFAIFRHICPFPGTFAICRAYICCNYIRHDTCSYSILSSLKV